MQVFLVLLVGVTAAFVTPEPAVCPQDTAIYPCICSTESIQGKDHLNLDCSEATSNYVLESVFQPGNFHCTKFLNLTINPVARHPALTALNPTVFGNVSFEHILINNTYIRTINEEALAPSHDTLLHLILSNNMINAFPFETLSLFAHLRFFNLANNKLLYLPNIESNSLYQVDLSGNIGGLTFTADTFKKAPSLEEIDLNNMGLTSFPPNVFSNLNSLRIIDLSNNNLKGVLGEDVIRVPLDSVEDLRLNGNDITNIHPTAITGVDRTAKIDFMNNKIATLDKNKWYPLLDQMTGLQTVDLRDNNLSCFCDVVWLLLDKEQLDKIHAATQCTNGTFLKDTDIDLLLLIC